MKYRVYVEIPVTLEILVDAENEDDAINEAMEYADLANYAGNGGTDKLVGTREPNVSLYPGEGPLEGTHEFSIAVHEDEEAQR